MIGTDEMSSTSMDISESFRAEDLSKTDFFDFVTAPDMGIGIGVGVGVGVGVDVGVSLHSHHQRNERTAATHLTNDGGGGRCDPDEVGVSCDTTGNSGHPTLHAYDQFWNTDKDHSRLESTIFEDLDRYCWQQHQQQQQQQQQHPQLQPPTQSNDPALTNPASPAQHLRSSSGVSAPNSSSSINNSNAATAAASSVSSSSVSQAGSAATASSIDNTDGQIYTITVLNGNEPWLKREPDAQLAGALDLDSLLGNFPGFIKSEYPYDDSGFSTDGNKDNSDASALNLPQMTPALHGIAGVAASPGGQNLPSLVTALSVAAGTPGGTPTVEQQFSQFQNNNNDWQMANNNAHQNSAESLLRSALQGKGYSKGLHMQNGPSLLPTAPSVKEEEMRRILFSTDADTLAFANSALSASQLFEDNHNAAHNPHAAMQHATAPNGPPASANNSSATTAASIIVDDMFLSLESAFSDDFEKIKRIASEVQQFCTSTPIGADYAGSDVLMQISPSSTNLRQLHSPATTPLGGAASLGSQHLQQVTHPPPQPLKPEVTTSTATRLTGALPSAKATKKYKRSPATTSTSTSLAVGHGSNHNPSAMNSNNSSSSKSNNGCNTSSNNNSGGGGGSSGSNTSSTSSSSPTHCNGQRKERSLHYCSICSKGFKDKYSVNVHIRTHTGEKPFACSLCGKSFRQKAHLAKHYQTHMAQKSNGSLVKSGAPKHHRSSATLSGAGMGGNVPALVISSTATTQHRQLNVVSSAVAAAAAAAATASVVAANGPPTVLPPATGLIANR